MSTIKVENLTGLSSGSNANKIIVPSGQTLHAPGHILQTVNNTSQPTAIESINNNNVYVATGVHATITPKSATSKLLIMCDVHVDSATGTNCSLAIHKDGTKLAPHSAGTGGSDYDGHAYFNRLSEGRLLLHQTVMASDAAVGSTSAITYKLYLKTHSGLIYLRHDLSCPRIFIWEMAA